MASTNEDTFAAFVSMLTEALDDHDLLGDDLAARVHLSRFHVDRVVAAMAGEPPASLRRRVLLERAAYRLDTTDLSVLEVALEAATHRTRHLRERSRAPTASLRASGAAIRRRYDCRRPTTCISIRRDGSAFRHAQRRETWNSS